MRMLSGEEAPDGGTRTVGHQVVLEYFAQDEATRLDPRLTVYETLEASSAHDMVPAIRNILGGFLFSGDDIYKKAGVLSGGERTRLAVARMLLRASNTLLMDEPTNHLDLDSKDVLLDALEDYGGTLIIVSHDRYFVEKLATKIIEVGQGAAVVYPGTYGDYLWRKEHPAGSAPTITAPAARGREERSHRTGAGRGAPAPRSTDRQPANAGSEAAKAAAAREGRKREEAERRKRQRAADSLRQRIAELESRIAEREAQVKALEAAMAAPGFYDDREASKAAADRHQALMWEVGDLMAQWEGLQQHAGERPPES
jgi:ATP-binding cassette subfamily F protein 3